MLEEVGEPGAARHLVARSDVVNDRETIHRGAMVFLYDDAKTVLEADIQPVSGFFLSVREVLTRSGAC